MGSIRKGGGICGEARFSGRQRSKRDSGHLAKCYFVSRKKSGVVPQQRPVISQSAFSLESSPRSHPRAVEPRRLLVSSLSPLSSGRNANGSNLGRAISSIRGRREARTAQSMKNNLGEILGISRLGPAVPFFVEFTIIDRGWKYDRRGRITLVAAIKDKESVNR